MPAPSVTVPVGNSHDSVPIGQELAQLDDFQPSQVVPLPSEGIVSPAFDIAPGYAGPQERQILETPGSLPRYEFLNPAPGSVDLAFPRDAGSVPGTVYENIMAGPVSGYAMDADIPVGLRPVLLTRPPGQLGPVVGGEDYATMVANAAFQEAFAVYSNAPSDNTIISAI